MGRTIKFNYHKLESRSKQCFTFITVLIIIRGLKSCIIIKIVTVKVSVVVQLTFCCPVIIGKDQHYGPCEGF